MSVPSLYSLITLLRSKVPTIKMVYFELINSFNFDVREKRKAATVQFLSRFEFRILKFTLSYTVYLALKNIIATNILIFFFNFHINGKEDDFSSPISQHQGTEFDSVLTNDFCVLNLLRSIFDLKDFLPNFFQVRSSGNRP